MFYGCLILLYIFISGMLRNAVIRNKRIQWTPVSPDETEKLISAQP